MLKQYIFCLCTLGYAIQVEQCKMRTDFTCQMFQWTLFNLHNSKFHKKALWENLILTYKVYMRVLKSVHSTGIMTSWYLGHPDLNNLIYIDHCRRNCVLTHRLKDVQKHTHTQHGPSTCWYKSMLVVSRAYSLYCDVLYECISACGSTLPYDTLLGQQ